MDYNARELVNWSVDEFGAYEWIVLRTSHQRPPVAGRTDWTIETRWLYYDRTSYQVWIESDTDKDSRPTLLDQGLHALAARNRVPLFELKVSEGLWLMNKASQLQLEHFNKSNALSWALTMGLFAMPVIYSDRDWKQVVGESYYIQLGQQDRFGWTEPEGRVFQIAANLGRLQEEIYRVCYLLHQARGLQSSGFSQSGLSKQRDFAITQEVLRAFGDMVKDYAKHLLRAIATARQDSIAIDVGGMDDFDIGEFSSDLADAERLLSMGIESPTLRSTIFKKLASKYLSDVRQEVGPNQRRNRSVAWHFKELLKMDSANRNPQDDLRIVIRQAVSEFVEQENGRVGTGLQGRTARSGGAESSWNGASTNLSRKARETGLWSRKRIGIRQSVTNCSGTALQLDLAFRAVKDDIRRAEDGRLYAQGGDGDIPVKGHPPLLIPRRKPKLLPPRILGGSGSPTAPRSNPPPAPSFVADLDKIRPGMDKEELERFRQEVARVAMQTLSGR